MKVKIHVNRYLTKFFNQTGDLEVDVENDATVEDLLFALRDQHGVEVLKNVTSEVELRRYFIVVINGKFALYTDPICEEEKEIKLIPPISGG